MIDPDSWSLLVTRANVGFGYRTSFSDQTGKVDLLNDVTSHKRNIHRRIRTNDPWSPRATYVLSVPGIVVPAATETPCGLVMCANCNPVYFEQMACFSSLSNSFVSAISLNIRVNHKTLLVFFFQSPKKFKCIR